LIGVIGYEDRRSDRSMNDNDFDLPACLERVRARDENAARALVEHLYPLVAKLVQAHLPRNEDMEDLAQDVFLKIFTRLDQFRGQVPFEHWVSRVAISTCIDRLRAQQRRPCCRWSDLSEEEQRGLTEMSAEISSASEHDGLARRVLEKLLASLAPAERLIVQLIELEQKSIKEVTTITGWNAGVVRIRAFRARQKLKSLYQKLEQEQNE
jgi:RNA polymerase sigma factor (sigma-70 family)